MPLRHDHLIESLRSPACYGHPVQAVQVVEMAVSLILSQYRTVPCFFRLGFRTRYWPFLVLTGPSWTHGSRLPV